MIPKGHKIVINFKSKSNLGERKTEADGERLAKHNFNKFST